MPATRMSSGFELLCSSILERFQHQAVSLGAFWHRMREEIMAD